MLNRQRELRCNGPPRGTNTVSVLATLVPLLAPPAAAIQRASRQNMITARSQAMKPPEDPGRSIRPNSKASLDCLHLLTQEPA